MHFFKSRPTVGKQGCTETVFGSYSKRLYGKRYSTCWNHSRPRMNTYVTAVNYECPDLHGSTGGYVSFWPGVSDSDLWIVSVHRVCLVCHAGTKSDHSLLFLRRCGNFVGWTTALDTRACYDNVQNKAWNRHGRTHQDKIAIEALILLLGNLPLPIRVKLLTSPKLIVHWYNITWRQGGHSRSLLIYQESEKVETSPTFSVT